PRPCIILIQCLPLGQRCGQRTPHRIEDQRVGECVQDATAKRAQPGECLQRVARHRQHDRAAGAQGELGLLHEILDLHLADLHAVQLGQRTSEAGGEHALDHQVAAGRHRGHRADDGATRVFAHDAFGLFGTGLRFQHAGALVQAGEHGVFAKLLQPFGAGRGKAGECLQQGFDRGLALALDRFGAAVGELALVALAAAGADRQHGAGDATRLLAQPGEQLVALAGVPLIGLVQRQQQRLAEIGEPAQLVDLGAGKVASTQIDHRVRAQRFFARGGFAPFAATFAASGYVGQHHAAAIGQGAVVVADDARGAAACIAGELGQRRQRPDQARFAGGDFAEYGDMQPRTEPAPIEFAKLGGERAGVGAVHAQLVDALLEVAAIGYRQRSSLASRTQQPPQHAQPGGSEDRQHRAERPLQCRRQGQEALGQREEAFGGGEQQPQQRGHGQCSEQQSRASGHAGILAGRSNRPRPHRDARAITDFPGAVLAAAGAIWHDEGNRGNPRMLASLVLNAVLALAAPASSVGTASVGEPVAAMSAMSANEASIPATPQFRRYGVADGVPSGSIYAVAQDRRGLMWFGADGGLVRYDGIAFKVFRHVPGDPLSLPSNQIYTLFVDRANRIWAGGVSAGLIVYDQASGRFRHWEHDAKDPHSLSNNEVWSIAQTPDGQLWVATQGGLDRMRADGNGFDQVPLDVGTTHAASFGPTRALLAGRDGRLWIGTESGLYVRSPDGTIRRVAVDPAFHGDIGAVWRIEGDADEVRVAVTGGLLVVGTDGVARPLANQQLAGTRILGSVRDNQGRLWLGSLDGVWLDSGKGPLQHIVGEPLLPGGLPSDRLWQIFRDREGGLWFAFDQSAIAYLPPSWNGFARFTHVPDQPGSLSNTAALSVLPGHDGKLWVSGYNGWVDKLDTVTGEVTHVVHGLTGNLTSLAEDARGRLWMTGPGRIYRYDHGK